MQMLSIKIKCYLKWSMERSCYDNKLVRAFLGFKELPILSQAI